MSKKSVEALVEELVLPITEAFDLELVDVEFVKEGADWYLRVFLDKPGGVEIEDCQAVSGKLSNILDEKDPIPQAYYLEVSSPGLDRPLKKDKDFERYQGRLVRVNTFAPLDGQKSFLGNLVGLREDQVVITQEDHEYSIPRDKVSMVRLELEF
ncbi:MAG: ribosome maturation factor RimP [Clostridia bacterium]|nr:ribosome maturation factor RimP [Clostridia bacterium]